MLSKAVSDAGDPKPRRHFPVGSFEDYSILSLNNFLKFIFLLLIFGWLSNPRACACWASTVTLICILHPWSVFKKVFDS